MDVVNVLSYHTTSLGIGTTEPFLSTGVDNNNYVTKVYDSAYQSFGAKHLINEYISYKIAKRLDLPIPDAKLLRMPDDFQSNTNRTLISNLGFGSRLVNNAQASLNKHLIRNVKNKDHFADILFFDQFLLNGDRADNDGNLMVDMKKREIFMIDHTHILVDNLSWTANTIRQHFNTWLVNNFNGHIYKMLLEYIDGHSPFYRIISKIENNLTDTFITNIVHAIPDEWDIEKKERIALIDFLKYKVQNILNIAKEFQKNWPNIVGYS